jgi:hypothetical protein
VADVAVKMPPLDPTHVRTNRLAWGVMLVAFAVFCMVCIGSGLGVYYFLFKSTVPMRTVLTVGRGTPVVTDPGGNANTILTDSADISSRSLIRTDSLGQALLTFYDEQQNESHTIASITLISDTSVNVEETARPRFDWSATGYVIRLRELSGRLEIVIPNGSVPAVEISILTKDGSAIRVRESGRYSVVANEAQVRVEALEGSAEFNAGGLTQELSGGERVRYDLNKRVLVNLTPYVRLLGTSDFEETNLFSSNPPQGTPAWQCYNTASQPDNVVGSYGLVIEAGRSLLHLARTGSEQHGRTMCITSQGSPGIDVTGYKYLSLEVLFRINYQSLSACGQEGTECPMMLELDYVPAGQQAAVLWNHGFYLWNSQPSFPLSCTTCTSEHERVNTGVWYRYRSDNLFILFGDQRRPATIAGLWVYAQGHEYDTYISEVSLFASEEIDPPPPVGDPSLQG